jgi:CRISPR-associated protein (TIGR02584 family)
MSADSRPNLFCVSGLTPQILTETVFALIVRKGNVDRHQIPRRIEIVTTTEGRRLLRSSLFPCGGKKGQLDLFCDDYGIDRSEIQFDESCIHVIRDCHGTELSDITDDHQNSSAADLISERIRFLCTEESAPLHVSLAGGRKTMGFYAGYALSLYGRPHDRLSHVLINPPFESHPDFYYPPKKPRQLYFPNRDEYVCTSKARVSLANIPVVLMSGGLDQTLKLGTLSFSQAVARAQDGLTEPSLTIDLSERKALLQGHGVKLSKLQLVWLVWLAERAQRGEPGVPFDEQAAAELRIVMDWMEGAGWSPLKDGLDSGVRDLRRGDQANYFDRTRTRLNKALEEKSGLQHSVAERYFVHSFGGRPKTYGLRLRPSQIQILGQP